MNEQFDDILESINLMHKKYKSKEYIENIDKFSNDSKDLEQILEKYKVDPSIKKKKKFTIIKKRK